MQSTCQSNIEIFHHSFVTEICPVFAKTALWIHHSPISIYYCISYDMPLIRLWVDSLQEHIEVEQDDITPYSKTFFLSVDPSKYPHPVEEHVERTVLIPLVDKYTDIRAVFIYFGQEQAPIHYRVRRD